MIILLLFKNLELRHWKYCIVSSVNGLNDKMTDFIAVL